MNRIHTGVRAYAFRIHIPSLPPVPVRVEERSTLADAIQAVGMCYLMDVKRQVENRIAICRGLTIDVLMMNAVRQRTADTIIRCRIIGLTVSSILTTDKQHTFPLESVVFAEIFRLVEIIDRVDVPADTVDRVAAVDGVMLLSERMQTNCRYIQYETVTDTFTIYPFSEFVNGILTVRTEVLCVVINRINTQGECHDRVTACY